MAYTPNLAQAAKRHYDDGKKLQNDLRFDNAGYHFGFAAECAVKQVLLTTLNVLQSDAAIWAHFPDLQKLGRSAIASRNGAALFNLLNDSSFMQEWDTVMRYAKNTSITADRAEKWRNDANRALGLLL